MQDSTLARQVIDDGFNCAAKALMSVYYEAALIAHDAAAIQNAGHCLDTGLTRLEVGKNYIYELLKLEREA